MMRECWNSQVPAAFIAAKMRYKMNQDYEFKEARRKIVRMISKASKSSKKRRAAKHSDRKETQEKLGEQMMELVKQYSPERLAQIPKEVKDQIMVRKINRSNARSSEDRLLREKNELADALREKRSRTREPRSSGRKFPPPS